MAGLGGAVCHIRAVGMWAYIAAIVLVLGLGRASAQGRIDQPPSTDRLVEVMRSSLFSADAEERLEAVSWLSSRRLPSALAILNRLSHDPSPDVRHQAVLGLARISPDHVLGRFQIRTMSDSQRAELVRRAAGEGLIGIGRLESMASDETAGALERVEALLALQTLDPSRVPIDRWVALIGCDVDAVRLLAALMTISHQSDSMTRSVLVAHDFARAELDEAVRSAARGEISAVIEALHLAGRAHPAALPDWADAIIRACDPEGSPAVRLVRREALRARLRCDPAFSGSREIWNALWVEAGRNREAEARLSRWTLEIVTDARRQHRRIPLWIPDAIERHGQYDQSRLAAKVARAGVDPSFDLLQPLARLVNDADAAMAGLAWSAVLALPESQRMRAMQVVIQSVGPGLPDARLRFAVRALLMGDPVGAQICLAHVTPFARDRVEAAYALAGAGIGQRGSDERLELLAALCRAESAIAGEPTAERLELASVLEVLALDHRRFGLPIRAEAAWLAMVLRDQGSEALAHLPRVRQAEEFRPEPVGADRLSPWAQMQYP
ncbi:MAG TPA: HEAT repeat domain-containing protein [Phycisphaerales bacterium]|nr:HEAT repeat domain-containing protein [Phycisphaerales bacterium]